MASLGNFIPNKPSPSRHKEPYLDTRQNFRHIISDFTAVSHLTMELAAAAPSEPPSVTELPSVGGGVQYQLYSCTVYSRHPVQLSAHGPLLSGARLVTPGRSGSHPLYSV